LGEGSVRRDRGGFPGPNYSSEPSDPFGHQWQLATHVEDVSPEQIRERVAKMFGASK